MTPLASPIQAETIALAALKPGESATVVAVDVAGDIGERLMEMGVTPGTQITLDPDYNKCADRTNPGFPQPCKRTFAGVHGGGNGINFVFVDGSVQTMTTTGDIRILSCLATIAGRETISQMP